MILLGKTEKELMEGVSPAMMQRLSFFMLLKNKAGANVGG